LTRAAKRSARSDHAASSFSSQPYSFNAAPHPAAFTMKASTSSFSREAMLRRARPRASVRSPACA
jgi:hypothetical protein